MEENKENIIEETLLEEEKVIGSPAAEFAEVPEVETADTPVAREKKETSRRKKQQAPEAAAAAAKKSTPERQASPEVKKETSIPRLKPSLRHGFQLKGHYYSRAELGRKSVLVGLWKKYPGLFEK